MECEISVDNNLFCPDVNFEGEGMNFLLEVVVSLHCWSVESKWNKAFSFYEDKWNYPLYINKFCNHAYILNVLLM